MIDPFAKFPKTVNRRVADRLDTLAETWRSFQENGQATA
jgi:hypothetical protein